MVKKAPRVITRCRICGGSNLQIVLDLGVQHLTGVFPKRQVHPELPKGPLKLVRCSSEDGCGLIQLMHTYEAGDMYGENYGYRSGLNSSMTRHLKARVDAIIARQHLSSDDVVVDIGSNDGTSLSFFPDSCVRIGIDPTADKFQSHYPAGAIRVSDFFSEASALRASGNRKATVITAFSMMYDLEDPALFVQQVAEILEPEGVFVFEQSYLPLMLERVSFDTICHEHLEYYGLKQIDWILETANLEVVDVELNDVNGGSFAVTAAHRGHKEISASVERLRLQEGDFWARITELLDDFSSAAAGSIHELISFIEKEGSRGRTFAGLGASTKGNVLLQYAKLGPNQVVAIGDVNPDKHGSYTPGSGIAILPEDEVLRRNFDYYIVLPWHFRNHFVTNPKFRGRQLVFPLPELAVVTPE